MDEPEWTRCPVLRLSGDIDMATAPTIRFRIGEALTMSTQRAIILDLADVTFMDSSGVGVLVTTMREGAHVRLRNVPDIVMRVLQLSGVDALDRLSFDRP